MISAKPTREEAIMHGYVRIVAALVLVVGASGAADAAGGRRYGVLDEESGFLPGKYFELKAQSYVKSKDYAMALKMYQLSGFWGDKIAQYNAAVMLFNGLGVPQDKVLGTAWFRIAAESHGDLAESALGAATAELTADQRRQADATWSELEAKYGNDVTFPRALARFQMDMNESINHGMPGGPVQVNVSYGDGQPIMGTNYYKDKKAGLAETIGKITGNVTVGQVKTISLPDEVTKNASSTPLTGASPAPDVPPAH
jgi:hypothetical protein